MFRHVHLALAMMGTNVITAAGVGSYVLDISMSFFVLVFPKQYLNHC